MIRNAFLTAAVLASFSGLAQAALISGNGAPISHAALNGGTVIDFDDQAAADYIQLTIDDVTFSSVDSPFTIGADFNGSYNTGGGQSLFNGFDYVPLAFRFDFATTVTAFGFNWGAADFDWTLSAYDSADNLLDSQVIAPTFGSNAQEFFGIAAAGIAYATLSTNSGDYVFIDNFTYAGDGGVDVPVPASAPLALLMLAGLAGVRRRAQR